MSRFRLKRDKAKQSQLRKYLYQLFKLVLIFVLLYLFSKFKPLLLIAIFELLDFFKNVLKQTIQFIPVDFVFVFGITAAYYYGFIYAVIIFLLGAINRILMSCIEMRHVSKAIRHLPLFFLITFFKGFNFFIVAISALIFNYVLKYGLKIAQGNIEVEKTHFHIINFIFASVFFYALYILYFYLPFLA